MIILILFISLNASAADSEIDDSGFNFLFSLGLTSGGETLAETTGGTTLKSGGLLYLSIGTVYKVNANFQLQGAFGYHFDHISASDGSADFSRTFIELIPFFVIDDKARIGFGILNAMSPKYTDPYDEVEFSDASGVVVELDWHAAHKTWIGLRYAKLDYGISAVDGIDISSAGLSVDGSYYGLVLSGGF
jgi:hypothetical protein